MYKMRVETQPDGSHFYRLKTWLSGTTEPTTWTLSGYGLSTDPDSGSLLLLAHHVDATFGDVTITPLGETEGTLNVADSRRWHRHRRSRAGNLRLR